MTILTIFIPLALCQTQHNTWQGSHFSVSLTAPKLITVCRWRTTGSVELLAYSFASRTFAYRRLAQSLSRPLSAFSTFMREYFDPVVKADQCAQYVDDIGTAANNATDLTRNIRAVVKCIRQAGLKLTNEKCHFGVRQVELLGRTISPKRISPQARKIQNFLDKLRSLNQKWQCRDIWVSGTNSEIIIPEWLKNLIHSTDCFKRKCQSILRC